jgi:glycosyltransferase involved in cell wall biosynthesis
MPGASSAGSTRRRRARRSVLLVAQIAPPSTHSGARRVAGLTKYLSRMGYAVTVLTSEAWGGADIPGATNVVVTPDLLTTRLNWLRDDFMALERRDSVPNRSDFDLVRSLVVPDIASVSWLPFALPRAIALARRTRFDCVLTTSPPPSAHFIGLMLKRFVGAWIADFRDGWTFDASRPEWPLRLQRALDRALERTVVTRATSVVAVTRPIAEDFGARFGVAASVVTNGFDPEQSDVEAPPERSTGTDLSPDRHSLVYTGRMGWVGRSPRPLLDALAELKADAPEVARRLEVVFAGPLSSSEEQLIKRPEVGGIARSIGWVEHEDALRLQRAADSLLVLSGGWSNRSVATGKLYEYLAAGKPILVLGEETEAARIVNELEAGIVAPATDRKAIARALRRLVAIPRDPGAPREATAAGIAQYSYAQLARQIGDLIENVCP